jgi:hypothetical protein
VEAIEVWSVGGGYRGMECICSCGPVSRAGEKREDYGCGVGGVARDSLAFSGSPHTQENNNQATVNEYASLVSNLQHTTCTGCHTCLEGDTACGVYCQGEIVGIQ